MLYKFLLMLALMLTSISAVADSGSKPNPSTNGDAVLDLLKEYPDIKRMPSRNHLEVSYANGIVSLTSDFYEGEFSMTFENLESGAIVEVPSISVGEVAPLELTIGEYAVTAIAVDGTTLVGYMEVY